MHYLRFCFKHKQPIVSPQCQLLTFHLDGLKAVSKLSIECVRIADLLNCCVAIQCNSCGMGPFHWLVEFHTLSQLRRTCHSQSQVFHYVHQRLAQPDAIRQPGDIQDTAHTLHLQYKPVATVGNSCKVGQICG